MQRNSITRDQCTVRERNGQLVIALNNEILLPENAPVRLTSARLEELDYRELYRAYSPKGRKSKVDPRVLFKVMVYGYQCGIYSSRKLEEACRYRIDFMRLLEDEPVPDHATFARFRTGRCVQAAEDLFYQYVRLLELQGEIDHEAVFIDGTKIESRAGRYTFCYSKTDPDATFMRMKDDHMGNGQLKPGYNVQIAVNSEYITGIDIFSNRTDYGTLIPFLRHLEKAQQAKYQKLIADAGYKKLENYLFLERNGQISFIKPTNYESKKTKKFKRQIGRIENMRYDAAEDCFFCAQGRKLVLRRECTQMESEQPVTTAWYRCENCKGCPQRNACCKAKDTDTPKEVILNKTFWEKREKSQANISTEQGIYLRICRSIQVEGAFALLKTDFGFRRFLTRGRANVRTELFFLAMAFNLKKLWMKRENGRLKTHLSEIRIA